jgi:N5-(cytidine 5'-diphosphoramidyl)-L-glutamine hydrolase
MKIGPTQRVDKVSGRNERRDTLDQTWAQLLLQSGFVPIPLPNQPNYARQFVEALGLSGVILTGGNDLADLPEATDSAPQRDAFERELLEICSDRRMPVMGVCRGMQMIVRYFGGTLMRLEDHVGKPHPIIPRASSMPTLPRAEVNSFHGFGIRSEGLPADLAVAGVAPDGTVEAVVHRSLPMWAVMWHPERPVRVGAGRDERDVAILRALFGDKHA